MIEKIRHYSSTWWFRTFLGAVAVIFALLWGGGDLMHQMGGGKSQVVATVGGERISSWDLRVAVDRRLKQFALSTGNRMSEEDALKSGVFQQVLRTLVDNSLVNQEAQRLGLTLSDDTVRASIQKNPAFLDEKGAFDKKRLLMILERLGYNESAFVDETRGELMRAHLLSTLFQGVNLPALESVTLYRWQDQTRQILFATISSDKMSLTQAPQEADLKEMFAKYKDALKAPEYRDLSVLVLDPQKMGEGIVVKEEELKQAYDARVASLEGKSFAKVKDDLEKELRTQKALELIYEQGPKIEDAVGSGMSLKEVSDKFHVPLITIEKVDASGAFDPFGVASEKKSALSDLEKAYVAEGFSLEPQTPGSVVEGPNHVSFLVHVDKVQEAHTRTQEEVPVDQAKKLWADLKKKEKASQMVQDIVANSKTIAEFLAALRKNGLTSQKMSLTRQGSSVTSRVILPAPVVERLFQGGIGRVEAAPLKNTAEQAEFFVGCVEAIKDPEIKNHADVVQQRAVAFNKMYEDDFVTSYIFSLRKRYPVEVNKNWFKSQLKG